jgi:hypothetical protein
MEIVAAMIPSIVIRSGADPVIAAVGCGWGTEAATYAALSTGSVVPPPKGMLKGC